MMLKEASIRKCMGALGLVAMVLAGASCSKDGVARADAPSGAANNDIPAVLATIGDEQITLADVQARVGDDLDRIETQYQRNRSTIVENALNAMLRERVLEAEAKKQGKTYEELVTAEAGGDLTPTEQEIAAWYQANPTRTGGRTLDQIRTQISDLLRTEKRNAAELRLQQRLNDERKVAVNFQPYRFTFNNENAATRAGSANAPVTLVEFSDFQCPFCIRFAPTLKQVEEKYGDKVQIVYRHYPISSIHPFAFKAAEASLCANEQGKFWELHDWMFANQPKLAVRDLKQAAGDMGMDKKKFDTCLDTGRYVEQVQNDMAEGAKIGVNGTPAVFVNGIELKGGAVGLDVVTAAIDKELERAKVAN